MFTTIQILVLLILHSVRRGFFSPGFPFPNLHYIIRNYSVFNLRMKHFICPSEIPYSFLFYDYAKRKWRKGTKRGKSNQIVIKCHKSHILIRKEFGICSESRTRWIYSESTSNDFLFIYPFLKRTLLENHFIQHSNFKILNRTWQCLFKCNKSWFHTHKNNNNNGFYFLLGTWWVQRLD